MRRAAIMIGVLALAGLAGCTGPAGPAVPAAATAGPAASGDDPQVVSHLGRAGVEFGDTRAELVREHGLVQQPGDCAPRLPAQPAVSPVFDEADRLVLLWVYPPLHTPAGLLVGSPVAQVRQAHPDAEELPAPTEPYRFHGLLVAVDDPEAPGRAYLFLHDRTVVQKVIIGYEQPARRLYHEQFGAC